MRVISRCIHRKRSVSCVPWRGVLPIRGGRLPWPFSRGSRVCSFFCGWRVEKSFSSYGLVFMLFIQGVANRVAKIGSFFKTAKQSPLFAFKFWDFYWIDYFCARIARLETRACCAEYIFIFIRNTKSLWSIRKTLRTELASVWMGNSIS